MKRIRIASAIAALLFVVASSFTSKFVTSEIYAFDVATYGAPTTTTVDDFGKYKAVSAACPGTIVDVCSIVYTGHSQEVGTVLNTDFSLSQKTALVSSQTNGVPANSNIKMSETE